MIAALSCAVIGAISGSSLTGIAAIDPLLIPVMEKRGYPQAHAAALIANSSILALLIPLMGAIGVNPTASRCCSANPLFQLTA